jgi:hypothetical protein
MTEGELSTIKKVYLNSNNSSVINISIKSPFTKVPKKVKVQYANIPYLWNNVSSSANTFLVSGTMIQLPPGYYTGTELAAELQTAIDTVVVGLTVMYTDGMFVFSNATLFTLDFTGSNQLADVLGFQPTLYTATFISPNWIINSVQQTMIDYPEILVCTNLISGIDNGIVYWSSTPPQSNPIAIVPTNVGYSNNIIYGAPVSEPWQIITNSTFAIQLFDPQSMPNIAFELFSPDGYPLDFSLPVNWSICLLFEF